MAFGDRRKVKGRKTRSDEPSEYEVRKAQEEVEKKGATSFLDTAKTAGGTIMDLISRPNYAIAGAVEEIINPSATPMSVPERMGTEVLSGISGLKGQKRGFAEVLEGAGVGTGGQLSDVPVISSLYNDTGDGWMLKRGGPLDPTARGAGGLTLDIVTDPLTWFTGGATKATSILGGKKLTQKGTALLAEETTKQAGLAATKAAAVKTVKSLETAQAAKTATSTAPSVVRPTAHIVADFAAPDTVAARALRDEAQKRAEKYMLDFAANNPDVFAKPGLLDKFIAKATDKGRFYYKAIDAMGNLFSPGWNGRQLQGFLDKRAALFAKVAYEDTRWNDMIDAMQRRYKLDETAMKRVTEAVDEGKIATLQGAEQEVATWYARNVERLLESERNAGIKVPKHEGGYFAHYYENDPKELARVRMSYGHRYAPAGDLARHLEERQFDTYRQAVEVTTRDHAIESVKPILKPLYDPFESLRRRGTKSIEARNWRAFEEDLVNSYGPDSIRFNAQDAFDLSATRNALSAADNAEVERILDMPSKVRVTGKGVKRLAEVERKLAAPKIDSTAKTSAIDALSPQAKQVYFARRLAKATSPQEVIAVLRKYEKHQDNFPRATTFSGNVAADGTPFVDVTLKGFGSVAVPESLADEIANMSSRLFDTSTDQGRAFRDYVLKPYDWINNSFKLAVTAWPAFHFRNAYSNVAQSFPDIGVAAFNPEHIRDTVAVMRGADGVLNTPLGKYTYKELRDTFGQRGVMTPGLSMLEYTGKYSGKSIPRRALEFTQKKVGQTIENEARVLHAIALMKRGATLDDAVRRVNKFLFDYNSMTDFEKSWMKRIFPFYTWMSRNLRVQADNLARRPGALANEVKPFRGREEEDQKMATWDAQALKIRLDRDGKTIRMLTGIDLPIRNLDLLWRGGSMKTITGIMGMMAPVLKIPVEYGTGYSLFQNKMMDRNTSRVVGEGVKHLPKPLRDAIGFKEERDAAGRPKYTFDERRFYLIFQTWIMSRLVTTSDRQFREYINNPHTGVPAAVVDFVTGIRMKQIDLTEQQKRAMKDNYNAAQEALRRRGERRVFEKYYKPKQRRSQ